MLFAMNKTINKSQGSAFLLLKTDIYYWTPSSNLLHQCQLLNYQTTEVNKENPFKQKEASSLQWHHKKGTHDALQERAW